jgi:hypothetical protein
MAQIDWTARLQRLRAEVRSVSRQLSRARAEVDRALSGLGLSAPAGPVVDLGPPPAVWRRVGRGLVVAVGAMTIAAFFVGAGFFAAAAFVLLLVVQQGLGLQVAVPGVRPAA